MERRNNQPPPPSFQTPLLSSKTLSSASSSRLPTRRPSISGLNESIHVPAGITMTAGRATSALRKPGSTLGTAASDNSISRLPQRRPSLSGEGSSLGYMASGQAIPTTASRSAGTLKRTSSGAGLPQADSELSSVKRQLAKALHGNEELKHTYERQLLEATSYQNSLQAQIKEYASKTERLEGHRALLSGKARENEEREKELRSEAERTKAELQAQTRSLRQELSLLKDSHATLMNNYKDLSHSSSQGAVRTKSSVERIEALEEEIEITREEKAESDARWSEERERRRAADNEVEKLKIEQKNAVNSEVVREELHRQVTHLRTLEKENQKLTRRVETYEAQHANIEILRESNKTLEKKLRGVEDLRKRLATAEIQVETLQREKQEWLSFLEPNQQTSEFSSPRKLTKTLAAAQIENATFRDRLDAHTLEIQSRDRMIGDLERNLDVVKKGLEDSRSKLFKAETRVKQEASGHNLLMQEVAMLKRHLDTYTAEEASNQAGNFDEQKSARLVELEAHLEAHKKQVMDLSRQVAHWRGLVERYGGSTTEIVDIESRQEEDDTTKIVNRNLEELLKQNEQLQEELTEISNENALLVKDVESLELENDRLTYEHNNGAYDPTKTKVLQLSLNPSSVDLDFRTSTMNQLREENAALLENVAELERRMRGSGGSGGGGDGVVSMVPRASLVNLQSELDAAKALVAQKEVLASRVKSVFSDKADEFRLVVQSLLGYQMKFLPGGKVRVTSSYAPNADHSLIFESSPGGVGTMEFVGGGNEQGELQDEVKRQLRFWVGERKCIPAFLASLTMTLFDSSTKGSSAGFVMQD